MFGLRIKVTCPNCNEDYTEDLGCATKYYQINGSKLQYTKCECWLCKQPFWLSHKFENVVEVKKIKENEELKWISTVCW